MASDSPLCSALIHGVLLSSRHASRLLCAPWREAWFLWNEWEYATNLHGQHRRHLRFELVAATMQHNALWARIQQTAVLTIFLGPFLMAWMLTFCRREVIGRGILNRGVILLPRVRIHQDIGDTLAHLGALWHQREQDGCTWIHCFWLGGGNASSG